MRFRSRALLAVPLLAAGLLAAQPAGAWWRGPGHWGWHGGHWGWWPGAVVGAIVGGAIASTYYAPRAYYAPPPAYYAPPPGYYYAPGYYPPAPYYGGP